VFPLQERSNSQVDQISMGKVKLNAAAALPEPATASAMAEKKKARKQEASPANPAGGTDLVSQMVLCCQEQRWREAAIVCRRILDKARSDENHELAQSMAGAYAKIDYSLRRQMAAASVRSVQDLLAKEFLLDVAE
jgi:hypothetical protein